MKIIKSLFFGMLIILTIGLSVAGLMATGPFAIPVGIMIAYFFRKMIHMS